MKITAYILTSECNLYDQEGEYFLAWFHKNPTANEICTGCFGLAVICVLFIIACLLPENAEASHGEKGKQI